MPELEIGALLIGLFGGLAIFLYGMEKLTDSLRYIAGDRLKTLLARMTSNRFKGVLTGATITATIQSSSITTVLVVGFISAGLLKLQQAIPIIMGAEIGTTVTAQIIAFKVTKYALIPVAVGFFLSFIPKSPQVKSWGTMIMGLGLVFFGMELMKGATSPLRDYPPFIDTMRNLDNPLVAVLFSATFTALIQSSSATTGVIIVLASQGFLSLEAGIALVFGANIGTCVTAFLASIGKPRDAVRAAMVHILFNSTGVLIWIGLIGPFSDFIQSISPTFPDLQGVDRLKAETPRQIANAHTVFNVANTLLFLPFTNVIAKVVTKIVPDRKEAEPEEEVPIDLRYDDEILVKTPSLALDIVRMELGRLGAATLRMARGAIDPVLTGTREDLEELAEMDDEVDRLHGAIVSYLGRLSTENLTEGQSRTVSRYLSAANYFENIGDMIETNLVDAGRARLESGVEISPATKEILRGLNDKVLWSVERATEALANEDPSVAQEVIDAKQDVNQLTADAETHLSSRLTAAAPHRLGVFRIETELVESLKRIYYFAKRIARLVVEAMPPPPEPSAKKEKDKEKQKGKKKEREAELVTAGAVNGDGDKAKSGKKKKKRKKQG